MKQTNVKKKELQEGALFLFVAVLIIAVLGLLDTFGML